MVSLEELENLSDKLRERACFRSPSSLDRLLTLIRILKPLERQAIGS
jgi:hypothetical protein